MVLVTCLPPVRFVGAVGQRVGGDGGGVWRVLCVSAAAAVARAVEDAAAAAESAATEATATEAAAAEAATAPAVTAADGDVTPVGVVDLVLRERRPGQQLLDEEEARQREGGEGHEQGLLGQEGDAQNA